MGLNYHRGRVAAVRRVTPHMARITFAAPGLAAAGPVAPDAYLKVFFPRPGETEPVLPPTPVAVEVAAWYRSGYLAMPDDVRPPMRTYTVRAARPDAGEVDVDFALHEDDGGPASTWAAGANVGDTVAFLGPHGLYEVPEGTGWQLLAGDQTALPAIGAIVESLPASTRAVVYVEVPDRAERQVFDTRGAVELHWVISGDRPRGEALLDAIRVADLPGGAPYAWVSGEAGMVKRLRRHLVHDRGFDKRAICFTGYWRQGMSEEAVGRANVAASS
ncbi:siderophore-interacting protein [Amycolatopsis sp. PS_44_ISF1]|uniref:siderophore-interacting protein n=1 Tax=Amycolatopsis sp. PS_44_ISF1 TaxID=2974917 RepID=UPI0028DFB21F|nr:siderophore-interacting protein [Amycolatopsis sp. PS_44_ISF1]MDT8909373.1 siderophore-interacting protein [Amycolatopsis sp. PS_44_ISF1]